MFGKKPNGDKHIASLIGAGSTLVGDFTFAGGLRIDGTVQGSVRCVGGEGAGMLVISEKGVVEGEVRAAHLVVAGRVTGPVHTTEVVELQPTARVTGDVRYRALEIHHGAVIEGRLVHEPSSAQEPRGSLMKLAVGASGAAAKT
jgi:cytoskeletal protein CcmA (bactofilin family)